MILKAIEGILEAFITIVSLIFGCFICIVLTGVIVFLVSTLTILFLQIICSVFGGVMI